MKAKRARLTVRLLVASTSSWTTKLLRFASSWITDEQRPVVLDEDVLQLVLGGFVDICVVTKEIDTRLDVVLIDWTHFAFV